MMKTGVLLAILAILSSLTPQDWYGNYAAGRPAVDPVGPPQGSNRVLRGGSWASLAKDLRCAQRRSGLWGTVYVGFRLVRMP